MGDRLVGRPFTYIPIWAWWRLRRRVLGGISDGASSHVVEARLGQPDMKEPGAYEHEEIWKYSLGDYHCVRYTYSVLVDSRKHAVTASWWSGATLERHRQKLMR